MSDNTHHTLPNLPKSGIEFPNSPIVSAALAYVKQHTTELVYNHCVRSAYWALLLAKKLPKFSSISSSSAASTERPSLNLETVVVATVLHDMGWATTTELLSKDKRFEVDGANIALAFVRKYTSEGGEGGSSWDTARTQLLWESIALHTTGSIALHHPAPEITLAHLGVMTDFMGPLFPPGDGAVVTEDEYRDVLAHFPLAGFTAEGCKEIMCGICRDKPETTYDNFASGFGVLFGLDGKGKGKDEFLRAKEEQEAAAKLLSGLEYLENLLKEG
ncbi:hypothetical protein F4821DRAFT_238207 [Hypoxylon rubiginosum]|uniref:Uncharacterized protein n=1 Tax=Hypoxylon rubiginosum TaxID=110542 RepID=A0ACC0D1S9_9PEZI|nr:hypothetical protein F4821DRAFT_238207 [Hypoxylon rubiginosum]